MSPQSVAKGNISATLQCLNRRYYRKSKVNRQYFLNLTIGCKTLQMGGFQVMIRNQRYLEWQALISILIISQQGLCTQTYILHVES